VFPAPARRVRSFVDFFEEIMLNDLLLFLALASLLARPNSAITSISQAGRRLRVSEDKLHRNLARFEKELGFRLVTGQAGQAGKLGLTPSGSLFAKLGEQMLALREGTEDGPVCCVIDCDAQLAETLLPFCFEPLFSLYGASGVRLEVAPLDSATVAERLNGGTSHLGLGWAGDGQSTLTVDPLDQPVPWSLCLPRDHPFDTAEVGPDDLSRFDRLFVASDDRSLALREMFPSIPPGRWVPLPSTTAVCVAVGRGTVGPGIVPQIPWEAERDSSIRHVPLRGVPPERPVLLLPRRASALTAVGDSLRAIVKRVAIEPCPLAAPLVKLPPGEELLSDASDVVSA
jgi:DNA-binding transcriptional LysR family regulator